MRGLAGSVRGFVQTLALGAGCWFMGLDLGSSYAALQSCGGVIVLCKNDIFAMEKSM